MNYIKHKCPACGYETDYDYQSTFERTKGDEDFIRIEGFYNSQFPTDVKETDYEYREKRTVTLVGCPKCNLISYLM